MKRKKPSKTTGSGTFASPEIGQIEQLLRFMSEHNLEEFEYSRGDLRIRLKKPGASDGGGCATACGGNHCAGRRSLRLRHMPRRRRRRSAASDMRGGEDLFLVKSPIVGTFYGSPSPGAEPFVKVGSYVEAGQTLCIVEAMKLMNEIESETSGEVLRIFVGKRPARRVRAAAVRHPAEPEAVSRPTRLCSKKFL